MFLHSLHIENFRRLRKAEVTFQSGLNLIVGENNSGKTAIIDAIRTVLDDRRFDTDDLRFDVATGKRVAGASLTALFDGLSLEDEAAFNKALIPGPTIGQYQARLSVSAAMRGDDIIKAVEAGRSGNSSAYHDVLNALRIIYLPALRDPDSSTGLRPGRQSRQADLLRRVSSDTERDLLTEIARTANDAMKDTDAVARARSIVEGNLTRLSGPIYGQRPDLNFVDPEFNRLVAQLAGLADGMPINLDGLGYANLFFVAAVLGDLEEDVDVNRRFRALLIEEPEAHLHPQHQILLLRFLQSSVLNAAHPIQIFVTTHSPILASQAAMDGLLPVVDRWSRTSQIHTDEAGAEIKSDELLQSTMASPIKVNASAENAASLTQYLDATRSELFFAARLILVEGDAERILIPELAKQWCGTSLEELGVTVVSAAGLNFAVFLPFIGAAVLNVPVAIVTDGDATHQIEGEELEPSDYVLKLRELVAGDACIDMFVCGRTFEHELALPVENAELLMKAMTHVRPRKTPEFREKFGSLRGAPFADAFFEAFFKQSRTSKPEFAMALALMLKRGEAPDLIVPGYLESALSHVLTDRVR